MTVTRNEILTALNGQEHDQFILAIVEVDGDSTHTLYLKQPFHKQPDFAATSVNYDITELVSGATIILER